MGSKLTQCVSPPPDEKRILLLRLNEALQALSRRMHQQQDNAQAITLLAARAERIAEAAWNLNNLKDQDARQAALVLANDIKALAGEAPVAAERAGRAALMGKQIAAAIAAHSAEIAAVLGAAEESPTVAAVRAVLRPLLGTLAAVPEQLKAGGAMVKDVEAITGLARRLAARADDLTVHGLLQNRAAVEMARDLRGFATEASAFSLRMRREAGLAVQAIETLSSQAVAFSEGRWTPDPEHLAHARLMALAKSGPQGP